MSIRILLVCALAAFTLGLGCSEGQVGRPEADGDVAPADTQTTDTGAPDSNVQTHPPDSWVPPNDTVDTGNSGLCGNGLTRCSSTGHVEACANGQWVISEICDTGCINGVCNTGTPGGTCANPLPLSIGQAEIGTTDTGNNPYTWLNSCTQTYGFPPLGPETVYELNVPNAQMLKITVTPIDPTYFAVYVRTTCTDPGSQLNGVCDGNTAPGSKVEITTLMPSGKHYIFVDDLGDGSPGEFQIKVEPASLPACGSQIPTIIDLGSGIATVNGDTNLGATSEINLESLCPQDAFNTLGPEVVYAFAVRKGGIVNIGASPTNPTDSMLGIYLRTDCNDRYSQPDDACGFTPGNGTATMSPNLAPGAYYLYVDDYASTLEGPDKQKQQFSVTINAP